MSERPKCGCGDHRHVYAIECHAYRDALREAADDLRQATREGRFTYIRDVQTWLRARAEVVGND